MVAARIQGKVFGVVAFLVLAGALPLAAEAQTTSDRGLLDQAKRDNEIAAQKTEAQIRAALRETQRLTLTDPDKAVAVLKKALSDLEGDTALSQNRRAAMVRMLKDRIRVITETGGRNPEPDPKKVESTKRKAKEGAKAAEEEEVQRTLATIADLQKAGKAEEANRLADQLARKFPANPSVLAARRAASVNQQLSDARNQRAERERRTVAVMRDTERSAMMPLGDIEFPKDWKERVKRRPKTQVILTTREKAIVQALNSPISVNYKDSPFQDVIQHISTLMNQPILLDKEALKDADINYDSPVTVQVRGVAVRTLLRKVLGEFGLTYVVKDEVIQVTTVVKAKQMMVVRHYPIGDLVANAGGLGGVQFGPGLNRLQAAQNIASIIDLIQTTIEPESWQVNGGPGTIAFNPANMTLVIKQSAEIHALLGGGGGLLR